jgi:hypothetical protein
LALSQEKSLVEKDQEPEEGPRADASSPKPVQLYHPNLSQNPFLEIYT